MDACALYSLFLLDNLLATRDDGLIGKTVRIQAGNWKGYLGTVCDATPQHVQVELHSRLKKVMVVRERVVVAGDKFGATDNADRTIMDVPGAIVAPTTPFVAGGATPMHGGATPLHGGATPMHDSMGYVVLVCCMDYFTCAVAISHFVPLICSGDEVWRPGGSIDQDAAPAVESNDNDGWGQSATSEEQNNPFGSPSSEADSGKFPDSDDSFCKLRPNNFVDNILLCLCFLQVGVLLQLRPQTTRGRRNQTTLPNSRNPQLFPLRLSSPTQRLPKLTWAMPMRRLLFGSWSVYVFNSRVMVRLPWSRTLLAIQPLSKWKATNPTRVCVRARCPWWNPRNTTKCS